MSENKPTQPGDQSDPLASLHRMSTTAGLASQEYVAINLTAVATLVLGLASALVLLGNVLLAVPIAAIICGIFALKQIYSSNGTQTGQGLAILGILVALGFGAYIGVNEYRDHQETIAERVAIEQTVKQFEQKLQSKDFRGALSVFTDGFLAKKQITEEQFALTWSRATEASDYGAIESVGITRLVLSDRSAAGDRIAGSMMVIKFEKAQQPLRREIVFRKVGSEWKIDDIPQIFPAPPPDGGGAMPPGAGPMM